MHRGIIIINEWMNEWKIEYSTTHYTLAHSYMSNCILIFFIIISLINLCSAEQTQSVFNVRLLCEWKHYSDVRKMICQIGDRLQFYDEWIFVVDSGKMLYLIGFTLFPACIYSISMNSGNERKSHKWNGEWVGYDNSEFIAHFCWYANDDETKQMKLVKWNKINEWNW